MATENRQPLPVRVDYSGPGAGTPCTSAAAFNRRYRAFQRQLAELGAVQVGPDGYAFFIEENGSVFYAKRRE